MCACVRACVRACVCVFNKPEPGVHSMPNAAGMNCTQGSGRMLCFERCGKLGGSKHQLSEVHIVLPPCLLSRPQ